MKAIRAPIAAPLPGKGTATKRNINRAPYRSKFFVCSLRVLSNILLKYLSINFELRIKNLERGSATASPIALGIRVPIVAKTKVLVVESPSFNPRGIANFSSTSGVIAAKNTFSSGIIVRLV